MAARDFYHSAYVTERSDEEILTRISFAAQTGGYAYEKQKRKIGDYATAAAAVSVTKAGGKVAAASIAFTNLKDTPGLVCRCLGSAGRQRLRCGHGQGGHRFGPDRDRSAG